ncbi:MAG: hypothetical protein ITD38_03350, partial [Nitrosospira sp.]|nr:hypothetical protein [Nitrosospira sp.]
LRRQLRTISNPESQTDALSFILTDAELALFSQYQASQPQRTFSRTMTIDTAGSGTAEAGVFIGSPPNGGPGILNFEIITAEPN